MESYEKQIVPVINNICAVIFGGNCHFHKLVDYRSFITPCDKWVFGTVFTTGSVPIFHPLPLLS